VIQWIPDHETLLIDLLKVVSPGGGLAVQIPNYGLMPISSLVDELFLPFARPGSEPRYDRIFTVHGPEFYANLLGPRTRSFDLWETSYFHFLPSSRAVVTMLESTGLRPYLDVLDGDSSKKEFLDAVEQGIGRLHQTLADGTVLFPFRRLFFVAYP